ncbi:uncharacterized protein DDB_G0283357-like [Ruditapes philippinarum]|uniref:uncharacterized protein DDB_G0283357-like n=1 Tax=Ruditapes philippinarum TaxID=129788 RepID=UPI00295AD6AA|nr:uncharacterized protein DDB_G0283357-like [Ruditapes philippinarum]
MKQTSTYLASRQFHRWLIPEKTVMGIFSLAIILIFAGAVLLAVSSVASRALAIIGGVLLAVGIVLLLVCIILCAHAWCIWHVRDVETQTIETTVMTGDQVDGDWFSSYGTSDKRVPNGVLRDGRQSSTLNKKHVTISPTSNESFTSGYMSGRQGDSLRSNEYSSSKGGMTPASVKSGPSSVSSDMSTLASFAYLSDPSVATPYSSLNQRRQVQGGGNVVQVPIHVQSGYGSVQRGSEGGRMAQVRPYQSEQGHSLRSNVLPARRHSDDDYDNTGEMVSMLPQQTYQPNTQQQWQQSWQQQQPQQQQQQNLYNQQWQHTQPPPQQTVWQYKNTGNQSNWRQTNPAFDDLPPPQPLTQPSQRRPMTFEQISSSKVSLYDNMQMARRDDEE